MKNLNAKIDDITTMTQMEKETFAFKLIVRIATNDVYSTLDFNAYHTVRSFIAIHYGHPYEFVKLSDNGIYRLNPDGTDTAMFNSYLDLLNSLAIIKGGNISYRYANGKIMNWFKKVSF